jgi:hypothetical protein
MKPGIFKDYAYGWITLGFFLISLIGHWLFGWFAYVDEQHAHQQPIEVGQYTIQMTRDTLENWQSEFLQLLWQVGGLALLLYVGSPQSKESDDRHEAKLDAILKQVARKDADKLIREIDQSFGREIKQSHAHRHK